MKVVEQPNRGVEIGGVTQTAMFRIASNGKIIKNVITSIYSQKEKTVVRELMANAFDAHVAAGKPDEPIDVFLPTMFEPNFVVRDYGIGMDHAFVMELFSVIGYSTKEGTNSQTGMFGVGSKSPLSICDTFTLRCYDKPNEEFPVGRVRLYTVSITDADVPQISHTFDVTPKEADKIELGGVEVKVPINTTDRQKLLDGLASQHFCWFDKKVNFHGALDEIDHKFYPAIIKLHDGLYIAQPRDALSNSRYGGGSSWKVFARQGAAVYPITEEQIRYSVKAEILDTIRNLCTQSRHVLIDMPLGTADVTMAREDIQYNAQSTKNIAAHFDKSFSGFRDRLNTMVGDAIDFNTALARLADNFIDNVADRKKLMSLKVVSSLLGIVTKQVGDNYAKHYDALPDVPGKEIVVDKITGYAQKDKDGNAITKDVMIRPKKRAPTLSPSMGVRDFPEGKVLLHSAMLYHNGHSPTMDISGNESALTFKIPNIIYVIPSHLQKWQDRLNKHAADEFKNEGLPDSSREGINVYIVRCSKRNANDVVCALKSHGVHMRSFGLEDMPDIEEEVTRQRNYSKTSVYKWAGSSWDESKLEPDYTIPAYYVARVNIAHEVLTAHPNGAPHTGTMTPKPKLSNYDVEAVIRDARSCGILDKDTPIYRVTENQAERINRTVPGWTHLPTYLALSCEKMLSQTDERKRLALSSSPLALSTGDYAIQTMVTTALGAGPASKLMVKEMFDVVYALAKEDLSFRYVIGVRHAIKNKTNLTPGIADVKEDLRRLYQALFGAVQGTDSAAVQAYTALANTQDARYGFIGRMLGYGTMSEDSWKHAKFYFEGFIPALKKELPYPVTNLTELEPLADLFMNKLDTIRAAIYPPATELEIEPLGSAIYDRA